MGIRAACWLACTIPNPSDIYLAATLEAALEAATELLAAAELLVVAPVAAWMVKKPVKAMLGEAPSSKASANGYY